VEAHLPKMHLSQIVLKIEKIGLLAIDDLATNHLPVCLVGRSASSA
jgi:hypothetical protein